MDSKKIAAVLEEQFPSYPLHLDSDVLPQLRPFMSEIHTALLPEWLIKYPQNVLTPESADFYFRTREEWVGMSLQSYQSEKGGEHCYEAARPAAQELGALLRKTDGPFLLGDEGTFTLKLVMLALMERLVSYADFVLVSFLHWFKLGDDKIFDRLVSFDPALKTVYDACSKWLERCD